MEADGGKILWVGSKSGCLSLETDKTQLIVERRKDTRGVWYTGRQRR
jgi:hypothetical protein